MRLRAILKEIKATKMAVAREMQGATFSISEAVWAAGDFRKKVVEAPQRERSLVRVRVRRDNVAGVKLPVFSIFVTGGGAGGGAAEGGATGGAGAAAGGGGAEMDVLGLGGGGRQIAAAKAKFTALLDGLIKLGSLQTSFLTLDEAIKVTNRRVNALDNVVIRECRASAQAVRARERENALGATRRSA